jgi:hypothetical protein
MTEDITNKEVDNLAKTLRPEHREFVRLYLDGCTPKEAHRQAGLAGEADNSRAAEILLKAPRVRLYIEAMERRASERSILTLEAIDAKLTDIAMADLVDVIEIGESYPDDKGVERRDIAMKDPSAMTAGQRAAIVQAKIGADGTLDVKMVDKLKALDMLIKRRGGYTEKTEVNHTGNVQVVAMVGHNGRGPMPKQQRNKETK